MSGILTDTSEKRLTLRGAPSLWRPMRVSTFRNLLIADVVSDIGTFMQSVGAAWLMLSFHAGPVYVALTQTATSLPYFLLALPAGSAGDVFDRRKLILVTELWMTVVALFIVALTIGGLMSPWLLLVLTFALAAGDAFETPTWRAVLPELVSKEDLAAASALNGIEFNLARAVGPALAGFLISAAGVAAAFVANWLSFLAVILVIARWKRPIRKRTAPPETFTGATVAAIRYIRNAPAIQALMVRTGAGTFFASALFALLPVVAKGVSSSAVGYGILLGCFGAGAVLGALAMEPLRTRWSTETVVSTGVTILGVAIVAMGSLHRLSTLGPLALIGGGAWILFISLVNALIQNLAPDWIRARVLAVFVLVSQGSMAFGSAAWGAVAQRAGIRTALLCAGLGAIGTTVLVLFAKLPDATADLSPWNHWRMPVLVEEIGPELDGGPVLVTVEYVVAPERKADFVKAIHQYERVRRRNGASRWGIFHDVEAGDRYLETFLVHSWAEHQRQHERETRSDHELEQRLRSDIVRDPEVRHLIFAHPREE